MDFQPSDDQRAFTAAAREFADRELAPHAAQWDATHHFPADDYFSGHPTLPKQGKGSISV